MEYPQSFEELVECFKLLPGIGGKGAERMTYHILEMDSEQAQRFSQAILNIKKKIKYCKKCGHICENDLCDICQDSHRDHSTICVVENPKNTVIIILIKNFITLNKKSPH